MHDTSYSMLRGDRVVADVAVARAEDRPAELAPVVVVRLPSVMTTSAPSTGTQPRAVNASVTGVLLIASDLVSDSARTPTPAPTRPTRSRSPPMLINVRLPT